MPDEKEKPATLPRLVKMVKALWGQAAFAVGIIAALGSAFAWFNEKIEAIERSSVDISQLKESLGDVRDAQTEADIVLAETVGELRDDAGDELEVRDEIDRAQDARITAVLNEIRARHGVIPLAGGSRRMMIQAAEREVEETRQRSVATRVSADPLVLDGP